MKSIHESIRDEKGFTLVELAVVMVIVGLLIGGILKGQEMIANQQVNSTIAQAKSVDAAFATFRDIYDAVPGDMLVANTRLAGCAGVCIAAGADGDGNLENAPFAAQTAESVAAWLQLQAADLIAGVNAAGTLPSEINGAIWNFGYSGGGAIGVLANARSGHYITLGAGTITPLEAGRIDRKVDDGVSNTGSVGSDVAGTCSNAAGAYLEVNQADNCGIAVRING